MPLTGELSDLSLAELIEFFCNQRKTGRLKVVYSVGPGYFYLQAGSVVHARIGELRGIEAVYCALTLPNASFTFSPAFEPPEHTISQPWTSVVLEGLRRMDEGVEPGNPFPNEDHSSVTGLKPDENIQDVVRADDHTERAPAQSYEAAKPSSPVRAVEPEVMGAFVSQTESVSRWRSRPWALGTIVAAVVLMVAVIGVPWAWYAHNKSAKAASQATTLSTENSQPATPTVATSQPSEGPSPGEASEPVVASDSAELARRQREARAKEKAKNQNALNEPTPPQSVAKTTASPSTGAKKVTVQVTYDENGRVTQASGGDATALRIARQKRFPAGKAGSATITIPIN